MYGCKQIVVKQNKKVIAILEILCYEAHKLINTGISYAKQLYFKPKKGIGKYDLEKVYKNNNHFKVLFSQAAQQILRTVTESFKSYYGLIKGYKQGKISGRPQIPNFRKNGGLATVSYPFQALKLKNGQIPIPLGQTCKLWFGLDSFQNAMPININFVDIKELRIFSRSKCFYIDFFYKKAIDKPVLNKENVVGVDPGTNWLICVSNGDNSLIIDGKQVRYINLWYNKKVSSIKENNPQDFWNKRLSIITEKGNRQIRNGIKKAVMIVINHCLKNNIGAIYFGWNVNTADSMFVRYSNQFKFQDLKTIPEIGVPHLAQKRCNKNQIELVKKNYCDFVPIPTFKLKYRIFRLWEQYRIKLIKTEESYTSQLSFLNGEYLPKYGVSEAYPKGVKLSDDSTFCEWKLMTFDRASLTGKRTKRGLYSTASDFYINADANASANIIPKVSRTLGLNLDKLSWGVLARPTRINLWVRTNKDKKCSEEHLSFHGTSLLESPRLKSRRKVNTI